MTLAHGWIGNIINCSQKHFPHDLVFLSTTVRVVRTSSTITTIIAKKARSRDKKMIVDVAFVIVYDGLTKVKNPSGFIQNVLWPNSYTLAKINAILGF